MFDFLKRLCGGKTYEAQKEMMVSGNTADRKALATDKKANPEILYYLASDADVEVRRAVAKNILTPVQASSLLARDPDVDVRLELAARLVDLLPNLSTDEHGQLYAFAVQALGMLAQDEVLKVRKALSTALKDHALAPPKVVAQLARDVEREVSEPILRFCVALSDDDLLDILSGHPEPWVISAITNRDKISLAVTEKVAETGDPDMIRAVVVNKGAALSQDSLRKIIDAARAYPEWHEPIVVRKELSLDLARQLVGFVNDTVMRILERRDDFDPQTRSEITHLVERRMQFSKPASQNETPEQKIERYVRDNALTADVIRDAMAWQEMRFVMLALARLARVPVELVEKIITTRAPKSIVALCWKTGLSMRFAVELQKELAKIPHKELIYARGGTDYPMSKDEMAWQLELFGISSL